MIRITANTDGVRAKLTRIQAELSPAGVDAVIERVALETVTDLVVATKAAIGVRPDGNRWNFEKPENKWMMSNAGPGRRLVSNDSKVMLWLDQGTRDHGPVTKKMLYIPLTRRAASGWNKGLVWGEDYILVKSVKGIKARNIVAAAKVRLMARLQTEMRAHIRALLKG
jgi:hypothetical protein